MSGRRWSCGRQAGLTVSEAHAYDRVVGGLMSRDVSLAQAHSAPPERDRLMPASYRPEALQPGLLLNTRSMTYVCLWRSVVVAME
jgi:hypothetical protein